MVTLFYFDENGTFLVISHPERMDEAVGECGAYIPKNEGWK